MAKSHIIDARAIRYAITIWSSPSDSIEWEVGVLRRKLQKGLGCEDIEEFEKYKVK